jgi:hypothetical protein
MGLTQKNEVAKKGFSVELAEERCHTQSRRLDVDPSDGMMHGIAP